VQRAQHPVKLPGGEYLRSGTAVPVCFPQLHSAEDTKGRKLITAPLHALQVPVQVYFRRVSDPSGPVSA
jgi:hypothetical protein